MVHQITVGMATEESVAVAQHLPGAGGDGVGTLENGKKAGSVFFIPKKEELALQLRSVVQLVILVEVHTNPLRCI